MPRTKREPVEEKKDIAVTEPGKRGRKPGSKNKAAAPKKSGRKAAPKKAYTPEPEVYFQIGGQEYDCSALLKQARAAYRATHKTGIHTCKVYIKPEESTVYYVINKEQGKIPLE